MIRLHGGWEASGVARRCAGVTLGLSVYSRRLRLATKSHGARSGDWENITAKHFVFKIQKLQVQPTRGSGSAEPLTCGRERVLGMALSSLSKRLRMMNNRRCVVFIFIFGLILSSFLPFNQRRGFSQNSRLLIYDISSVRGSRPRFTGTGQEDQR